MSKEIAPIQIAINNLLKGKTQLEKKPQGKRQISDKKLFIETINLWREAVEREKFLAIEVGASFKEHNNLFFHIMTNLVILKYGSEVARLVEFYVYEMFDSKNQLRDDQGRVVKLNTHEDLWDLIQKIQSTIEESKNKK